MSWTREGFQTYYKQNQNNGNIDGLITVPAGSTLLLYAAACGTANEYNLQTLSLAGTPMTLLASSASGSSSSTAQLWYLWEPPIGVDQQLTCTVDGVINNFRHCAVSYSHTNGIGTGSVRNSFSAGQGAQNDYIERTLDPTAVDDLCFSNCSETSDNPATSRYSETLISYLYTNSIMCGAQEFIATGVTKLTGFDLVSSTWFVRLVGGAFVPPTVGVAIVETTLPNGEVGIPYDQDLTTTGWTDETWSIIAGALPDGLSLTDNLDGTATIDGTPTVANTFNFTVEVDGTGNDSQALSIIVAAGVDIVETTLPNGDDGVPYDQDLTTTGWTDETWSVIAGALPDGLSLTDNLDGTATIDGTPTVVDIFNFTVQVDGTSNDTQALSITIDGASVNIVQTTVPNATVGLPYTTDLTSTGWTDEVWSVLSGALPTWATLTDDLDGTARIHGTPGVGEDGIANFTIQLDGTTNDTQAFTLTTVAGDSDTDTSDASGDVHFRASTRATAGTDRFKATATIDGVPVEATITNTANVAAAAFSEDFTDDFDT